MAYELITPPAEEPVSLIEAKLHCRVDHSDENGYLENLITLARRKVEQESWRTLVTSTWALHRDRFPKTREPLWLEIPPIQNVASVQYYDGDGDLQTLGANKYHVDTKSSPGRIVLKSGNAWPSVESGRPGAAIVTLDAGYGAAADVPQEAKHAMLLLIGHWYLNREALVMGTISKEMEFAYASLLEQLKWTRHAIID